MRATMLVPILLGAGALACSSSTEPSQDTAQSVTRQIAGIELTLITDRRTYAAGTPVSITIRAVNPSSTPVTFNFSSNKQYDVGTGQNSVLLWNYAFGRTYQQVLTSFTLQPGESWERTVSWDRTLNNSTPAPAGSYDVQGALTTSSNDLPTSVLTVQLQ
jgi:hypothetical protein